MPEIPPEMVYGQARTAKTCWIGWHDSFTSLPLSHLWLPQIIHEQLVNKVREEVYIEKTGSRVGSQADLNKLRFLLPARGT